MFSTDFNSLGYNDITRIVLKKSRQFKKINSIFINAQDVAIIIIV